MKNKSSKKINLKSEKGAITLYVLMAMLFFSAFLTGVYVMNLRKNTTQQEYIETIQQHYEQNA